MCGQYADNVEFMWRLARAYSDMCVTADNREEKRNYAEQGEEISHECPTKWSTPPNIMLCEKNTAKAWKHPLLTAEGALHTT